MTSHLKFTVMGFHETIFCLYQKLLYKIMEKNENICHKTIAGWMEGRSSLGLLCN